MILTHAGKTFFSEEKKQKTSDVLSRFYPAASNTDVKVFWFFFSKKNAFLRQLNNGFTRERAIWPARDSRHVQPSLPAAQTASGARQLLGMQPRRLQFLLQISTS